MTKKILFEEIHTTEENGLVKNSTERRVIKEDVEPDYVKVYLDMIMTLQGLPTISSPLLSELLKYMRFADDGQIIVVNRDIREEIQSKLKIRKSRYYQLLKPLLDAGVLAPLHPEWRRAKLDSLLVNPYIIGRGSWNDIKEIRACVKLNSEGGVLVAETEQKRKDNQTGLKANIEEDQGYTWEWNREKLKERLEAKRKELNKNQRSLFD